MHIYNIYIYTIFVNDIAEVHNSLFLGFQQLFVVHHEAATASHLSVLHLASVDVGAGATAVGEGVGGQGRAKAPWDSERDGRLKRLG